MQLALRGIDRAIGDIGDLSRRENTYIGRHRGIDVDKNARISGLIQLCAENTSWLVCSRAGNLDIEALGIVLGSILSTRAMERNP